MGRPRGADPTPLDRIEDLRRIQKAMAQAVREPLLRHARLGNPVRVWRDGRVLWLSPGEIPVGPDGPDREAK